LHVLSNLRAKQSIAPAKPTVHIAYTMKIGHAFEVSIVEVESFEDESCHYDDVY
jgi:hypothetical protein